MWLGNRQLLALMVLCLGLGACRPLDMYDQPKLEAYEASDFFADGRSARLPPEGTASYLASKVERRQDGRDEAKLPIAFDRQSIERGRKFFEIHCAPCHGLAGHGDGMIVERGFPKPPSLHDARLKIASAAYFYQVITAGLGSMPRYDTQIASRDRWNIITYVRVLQLSQAVPWRELPAADQRRVEESG